MKKYTAIELLNLYDNHPSSGLTQRLLALQDKILAANQLEEQSPWIPIDENTVTFPCWLGVVNEVRFFTEFFGQINSSGWTHYCPISKPNSMPPKLAPPKSELDKAFEKEFPDADKLELNGSRYQTFKAGYLAKEKEGAK